MATRPDFWPRFRRERLAEPEIYNVLQNQRRRLAVRRLCEHGGELQLGELAEILAGEESTDGTHHTERSVYNALHQTHLPKLESAGVIKYERETNTVTLRASAGDLERYLSLRLVFGLTWGQYYRTLATGCLLIALVVELKIGPFADVETLLVITLSLVVLSASMLYQMWRRRWIYVRSLTG